MGGRGSSSAGSRGQARGMTDGQLGSSIASTRSEMNSIGERMERAAYKIQDAQASSRAGRDKRVASARKEYNSLSDRYNTLRDRLSFLENERSRRRANQQQESSRAFVNSFGEATTRNITSPTYERAMRSQESRIRSFLGR